MCPSAGTSQTCIFDRHDTSPLPGDMGPGNVLHAISLLQCWWHCSATMRMRVRAHMMRRWCYTGRSIRLGSSLRVSLDAHSHCFGSAWSDKAIETCCWYFVYLLEACAEDCKARLLCFADRSPMEKEYLLALLGRVEAKRGEHSHHTPQGLPGNA